MLTVNCQTVSFTTILYLLAAGWVAFLLSLLLSFVFYAVHPSKVDVFNIKEKLKVNICGYKMYFLSCSKQGDDTTKSDL